jgi:TPR repeat protein
MACFFNLASFDWRGECMNRDEDLGRVQAGRAAAMVDQGDFEGARAILSPLANAGSANAGSADAWLLMSTFANAGESDAQFESRSFACLEQAARLGSAVAMRELGVRHDLGDGVEADSAKAAALFERSAIGGDPKGMFFHGRNLFYEGGPDAEGEALAWLRKSAASGCQEAIDFLAMP